MPRKTSAVFTSPYRFFQPVVDDKPIRDHPTRLLMNGQSGTLTSRSYLKSSLPERDLVGGLRWLYPGLSDDDVAEFLENTLALSPNDNALQLEYLCSSRPLMGRAFEEANTDVWTYRYGQPNPILGSSVVAYFAESWMMFNDTKTGNNVQRRLHPSTRTNTHSLGT
ncbi:hypothetical protein PM082_015724 [Marasmius tenuissimus]|nr:hypothetical protein PM082_015724 [Marasmius tenuissimus]